MREARRVVASVLVEEVEEGGGVARAVAGARTVAGGGGTGGRVAPATRKVMRVWPETAVISRWTGAWSTRETMVSSILATVGKIFIKSEKGLWNSVRRSPWTGS